MARQLDALDRQILTILADVSPISYVDIAASLETSEGTVRRRIRALVDDGTIEFVAVVKPENIGLHTQAVIGVDVNLNHALRVADDLKHLPQVKYLAYVTGKYDLIMTAYFASEDELFQFLTETLSEIPGVTGTETLRILKIVKRSWRFRHPHHEESTVSKPRPKSEVEVLDE